MELGNLFQNLGARRRQDLSPYLVVLALATSCEKPRETLVLRPANQLGAAVTYASALI